MEATAPVFLYGWDLKGFPKPVLKAWKLIHKVNDGKTPKYLIHVGVAVFHKFYHFNRKGLQTALEIPKTRIDLLPAPMKTSKSADEFEKWVTSSEIRNKFCSIGYNAVKNNCIDFAVTACKFLDVAILPGYHTQLNDWLKGHDVTLKMFKSQKLMAFFGGSSKREFVDYKEDDIDGTDEYEEENDEINEDELIGWEEL